ncbi:MAG: hypothetical protein ACPGSD_02050 [Flavobacteriales bacterium]
MKNLIKIMVIGLTLTFASIKGIAQNKEACKHEKITPENLLTTLDAKLDLNNTQEQRVKTLLDNLFTVKKALKEKHHSIKLEERKKIQKEVAAVLTKAQLAKYKAFKQRHKTEHSCHHNKKQSKTDKDQRLETKLKEITNVLELNERQKRDIQAIFEKKKSKFEAKRNEMQKQHKTRKVHFTENMKAILTAEQYQIFLKLKEERDQRFKY